MTTVMEGCFGCLSFYSIFFCYEDKYTKVCSLLFLQLAHRQQLIGHTTCMTSSHTPPPFSLFQPLLPLLFSIAPSSSCHNTLLLLAPISFLFYQLSLPLINIPIPIIFLMLLLQIIKEFQRFLQDQNDRVYKPRGIEWLSPLENGLLHISTSPLHHHKHHVIIIIIYF